MHGFFHGGVEGVALLTSEYVEDLDAAIALACSDVLVVGVKAHAEGLLGGVTQGILVLNLDLRVFNFNKSIQAMLQIWIMTYVKSAETGV